MCVSTRPDQVNAAACGWDQALFPLPSPLNVRNGSVVTLKLSHDTDKFAVVLMDPQQMPEDVVAEPRRVIVEVGEADMAYINDEVYHTAMLQAVHEEASTCEAKSAVFLVRNYSYWVIEAVRIEKFQHAVVFVDSEEGQEALQAVADEHTPQLKVYSLPTPLAAADDSDVQRWLAEQLAASGVAVSAHLSALLVLDAVESTGLLRQNILRYSCCVTKAICAMGPLHVVPHSISVSAQLFHSPLVRSWNEVVPENTAGVDVSLFNDL
jgi:hypothetical protein